MSLYLTPLQDSMIEELQYAILIGDIPMSSYSNLAYQIDIAFSLIWLTYTAIASSTIYYSRVPHYIWEKYLAD